MRTVACILLDVDGVLHVSGDPIPGAAEAVARLRRQGHSLRFVTNNSTRPRTTLAEELRTLGFELDDDELQTTARAAARELAGKRGFVFHRRLVGFDLCDDVASLDLVAPFLSQRARLPFSIVGDSAGMRMFTGMAVLLGVS